MDTDALRAHIRSGPQGPRIGAFFDFDGTIIDGYSASTLYRHQFRAGQLGLGEAVRALKASLGGPMTEQEFETFLTTAISVWTGRPQSYLDTLGEQVYREGIAKNLFHEAWRLVKAHQRAGHTVVIASSATRVQISAVARELGIRHILCTELQVADGVVTGRLAGRTLWGDGKEAAIRTFAHRHRLPLANACGYANGGEDIPFLGLLGHPYAVNPQPALARAAALHGWPVLAFQRGTARLDPRPYLRTGGMWATLVGAGAAGAAMSVLSRDRQRGMNLMMSCFAQVGAAVGDVRVNVVRGHGHLYSHRPAVFLINHQSALFDLLVGATVLREGVTALASKQIGQRPIIGPMRGYPQVVFLDRADSGQAHQTLAPALERLEQGVSILVAPEATRSFTPSVGQFTQDGFRLAQAAEVPLIPIVTRTSGQLMGRDSLTARPGTVEVVVHSPIPTQGWTSADVNQATRWVRQLYQDTLEDWPGPAEPPTEQR